jgi:hypothetical protein
VNGGLASTVARACCETRKAKEVRETMRLFSSSNTLSEAREEGCGLRWGCTDFCVLSIGLGLRAPSKVLLLLALALVLVLIFDCASDSRALALASEVVVEVRTPTWARSWWLGS